MALSIVDYNIKLTEIDRRIAAKDCSGLGYICWKKYGLDSSNEPTYGTEIDCDDVKNQEKPLQYLMTNMINGSRYVDNSSQAKQYQLPASVNGTASCARRLQYERVKLIAEMEKEQQYMKNQYILQEQQKTEVARQAALKAAEEVLAAKNKTEQEKQIAAQQLNKAKQELQKAKENEQRAKSAEFISKRIGSGDDEAARIFSGINTVSKYKTALVVGGVVTALAIISFVTYKVLKK